MNTYPNQPFKFRRQRRSDSVFANLTTEQHLQLRQWLDAHTYAEVVGLVAAAAPEGFGIKTHINSLHVPQPISGREF